MDFGFEVNVSINLPNPIKYAYENIRDYVWEGSEDEDEFEEG
jgi:hypothetical protein